MNEQQILEGLIEHVVYHNPENGYSVFEISIAKTEKAESRLEEAVCVGYVPNLVEGENMKVIGTYIYHPTYGKQLQIESYEKTLPSSQQGYEKYLASGIIKGIGPRLAKKIVTAFGDKTFEVIESTPQKLSKITGITLAKAIKIGAIFNEQAEQRNIMMFLQQYGISALFASKIYKHYKDKTMEVVKVNPYRLADEIFGIGFKMADRLAETSGIQKDSPFRIKSGIKYILTQESATGGHTFLPKAILCSKASELLEIPTEVIENTIYELQFDAVIKQDEIKGENVIYLNTFYTAEKNVAARLLQLNDGFGLSKTADAEKEIAKFEKDTNFALHDGQRQAVKESTQNGVLVVTGGPGTGKTTTINTIITLLIKEKSKIVLAAPTGRAAKRMTEATGMEAKTLHRLLEINFMGDEMQESERDEDNPLDCDVVIVDESSMIDITLMNKLLKAIPQGARLILVGDSNQLPSVGPGNVLKDIINSGKIKTVRLTEIFRQSQQSAIVMNAHRINSGIYPELNDKANDFFFIKKASAEGVISTLLELVTKRLPNFIQSKSINDIQVLTPMRKSPLGAHNLNEVLQASLNPPSHNKNEKEYRTTILREGDKVMQIKNNYNLVWRIQRGTYYEEGLGVFNGDCGIIKQIDDEDEKLKIMFDDNKEVSYDYNQLDELELAYAITVHKSQGSEYPVVVIPVHNMPHMLMTRNLLYTAITRAKKLVVVVGLTETLFNMVDNNKEDGRYSSLNIRLEQVPDVEE